MISPQASTGLDSSSVSDPEAIRSAFFEYNKDFRISSSKIACMLVIVLMPVGFSLDYFVYREQVGFFFLLRIICSLMAFGLWKLLGTSFGHRHFRILGMGWFVLPSFFISLMIYFSEGTYSPYYAGLNLVLVAVSWVAQVDFPESVTSVILTLGMYLVACWAHGAWEVSILFNNLYFIILTGIIVITGSYFLNRLRFREFALRSELDQSRHALESSNAKLIELDKAKTNFFANISHELRTPLTLLIGPLDKLRQPGQAGTGAEQQELIDIMYRNAMRLLRLINDLLNLVKLDSGNLDLRAEKTELAPFIRGIAQSVMPMAQERELHFENSISTQQSAHVWVDRDKVEKILLNLLFNAFKFTPAGGQVRLHAELHGSSLQLAVSDTGQGIAPEDLPHIFDRFWQAEAAATRRFQGVGIGLALVKELAQLHGGSVSADSQPGQGTTIGVRLDVSERAAAPSQDVPAADSPEVRNPEWLVQLYRRAEFFPAHVHNVGHIMPAAAHANTLPKVLIADDEPEMRRFLKSQLHAVFSVQEASNGAEALNFAKTGDYSLILLDYMMPEMDGVEVARQLRAEKIHRSVPIIILTARADEDSKMKALEAGATDFLTKPFASTELMVRCRNLVSAHQLQQHLTGQTHELENALTQIKETEAQLVHQAKMASLGQLSAGLMHEINNPLNFANTALHLVKKRLAQLPTEDLGRIEKPLNDMQDGIQRVSAIISSLRSFTHPDVTSFGTINFLDVVTDAVRFVQIDRREINLQINIDNSLTVWGNRNQLIHIFINLLQNSVDSLREKNAAVRELQVHASLHAGELRAEIFDNGLGIPPENQSRIFDAFFTTKSVGEGVGLGLNICHRIVRQHRGRMDLESKAGEFCRFLLFLPVIPEANPPTL